MSNESRIYGRRIASWLFLTLLGMHPLVSRPAFFQDAGVSSRLIREASDLVAELESQAASQKEQLQKQTEELKQKISSADAGEVDPFTRRRESSTPENMARDNGEAERRPPGRGQEGPSRTPRGGVPFIELARHRGSPFKSRH